MSDKKIDLIKGELPLGKVVDYSESYNPELLCAIDRAESRSNEFEPGAELPFSGSDIWTAYEISWLNSKGKPVIAVGRFVFPSNSAGIIESKSFKLYLNSFNQSVFKDANEVVQTLKKDLSSASGSDVEVALTEGVAFDQETYAINKPEGICLDELDIDVSRYDIESDYLQINQSTTTKESLFSNLFRTNCPVTGQPDWATIIITYQGPKIDQASLLKYLVSYRQQSGFHEQCTEHVFKDLINICQCDELTVEARFLRRGGLDINPFRTNCDSKPVMCRTVRQ